MTDVPSSCIWPHEVTGPIYVYDRDSFDKYRSGEYKLPNRCICGAEIDYAAPVCICLVERGEMKGEMIMEVKIPLNFLTVDLLETQKTEDELSTYEIDERVAKKLNAQADIRDQIDREQGAKFVAAVEEAIKGDQE